MPRNAAPEPVLSEVVRQRLAALLEEVPARRALGPPPTDDLDPPPADVEGPAEREPWRESAARWGRSAWEFTRAHLVAVGIILLLGCLWAGYGLLQARSIPVAVAVGPTTGATVVASPTPSPPPRILVHVLGAVEKPGVVELDEGSRVQDAIAAAGGLRADADPGELNLAAVLTDGTQLVIGDAAKPRGEVRAEAGAGGGGGGGAKLSLNAATQADLETLPGIGPVTAGRIIAWREEHGRFSRVEELQEIDGIGPKTYSQLAELVRL